MCNNTKIKTPFGIALSMNFSFVSSSVDFLSSILQSRIMCEISGKTSIDCIIIIFWQSYEMGEKKWKKKMTTEKEEITICSIAWNGASFYTTDFFICSSFQFNSIAHVIPTAAKIDAHLFDCRFEFFSVFLLSLNRIDFITLAFYWMLSGIVCRNELTRRRQIIKKFMSDL